MVTTETFFNFRFEIIGQQNMWDERGLYVVGSN